MVCERLWISWCGVGRRDVMDCPRPKGCVVAIGGVAEGSRVMVSARLNSAVGRSAVVL